MSMGDINSVILIGRITRDAELRYTASGAALSNFSIAVNRRVKKGDQWADEASFFELTLFGKTAENLNKYLLKGGQVAVQGSLKQDRWEKDGQKHSKVGIFVENVQLLGGGKPSTQGQQSQPQSQRPATPTQPGDEFDPGAYEDDIPF